MARTHSLTLHGPSAKKGPIPWCFPMVFPIAKTNSRQSGHYTHVDDDLRSIAALGVRIVRYGVPWRLTEPEPGHYDWTLWDRALARCAEHGLEPIVDMLHFGLPDSFDGFADQRWVDSFCRYVEAFLNRYQEPRWFTPINEPGPTAENSVCWEYGTTDSRQGPITRGSWPTLCWPTWRHWPVSEVIAAAGGLGPRVFRFRWPLNRRPS